MESIITAVITAIASVIVALIQANSANKQARILRQKALRTATPSAKPVKTTPESSPQDELDIVSAPPTSAKAVIGGFDRIWFLVGGILAVEAILFGIINQDMTPFVNTLALIPLVTCFLSYFRPILWGYSAVFVTFLQGVAFLGYVLGGGGLVEGDVRIIAIVFIANAGICALISFVRLRKKLSIHNEG